MAPVPDPLQVIIPNNYDLNLCMPMPLANITKEAFFNIADVPSELPSSLDQPLFDIEAILVTAVAAGAQPFGENNDDDNNNDIVTARQWH